jgi:hypothetical protein
MSYCRAYDDKHQVYMYHDISGYIVCCGCDLTTWNPETGNSPRFHTYIDALKHLVEHRRAGHKFPFYAFEGLINDMIEYGDIPEKMTR